MDSIPLISACTSSSMNKKTLRKALLQYRRLLPESEFAKRNQHLLDALYEFIKDREARTIHVFLPIKRNKEFDIQPLLPRLWKDGIRTMISATDFKRQTMEHFWLESGTKLQENSIGIPEPMDATSADLTEADLILVPLLGADRKGHRIGYGGGYYDRLLEGYEGESVGISLATLFDKLGTDSWDIAVNSLLFYGGSSSLRKP